MATFEIWLRPSNNATAVPEHILEASSFEVLENGTFVFRDDSNNAIHAIAPIAGMLVRIGD
jgi:hypothetical protein